MLLVSFTQLQRHNKKKAGYSFVYSDNKVDTSNISLNSPFLILNLDSELDISHCQ